jgi:hypothetical protein
MATYRDKSGGMPWRPDLGLLSGLGSWYCATHVEKESRNSLRKETFSCYLGMRVRGSGWPAAESREGQVSHHGRRCVGEPGRGRVGGCSRCGFLGPLPQQ